MNISQYTEHKTLLARAGFPDVYLRFYKGQWEYSLDGETGWMPLHMTFTEVLANIERYEVK